jgi:hypothetical protein
MSFICNLCKNDFTEKKNLNKHLNDKKCKSIYLDDLVKLNDFIEEQKNKINQLMLNGNTFNMKIDIQINNNINPININPIQNIDINYIDSNKMKDMIEKYDDSRYKYHGSSLLDEPKNMEKINMAISDYIKDMICNKEHPENHSVKYVKKNPPTFNSLTSDDSGKRINVINGLKDTCELLTDPILDKLKLKIKEFVQKYRKDDDYDLLYEDAIKELKKELNKKTVKKALSSVLKNDILNDIEMKLSLN